MNKRVSPALIGMFVVSGVLLGVIALAALGSGRFFRETTTVLTYFDSSVNGLQIGSSVSFKGVPIGSVLDIRLGLGEAGPLADDVRIPVIYEIDHTILTSRGSAIDLNDPQQRQELLDRGLSAQLDTESLVTGRLFIALDFRPDQSLSGTDPNADPIEIPSVPSPLAEVGAKLTNLVDKFADNDLSLIVESLGQTLDEIRAFIASPELPEVLRSVDRLTVEMGETLDAYRQLALSTDSLVVPTSARLAQTADQAVMTLAAVDSSLATLRESVDPRAPVMVGLVNTLQELELAAQALRRVAELIERNPGALIRGRPTGGN